MRLCLILALLVSSTLARVRSGGHGRSSYPSSNGLSGTGYSRHQTSNPAPHSYPHSDGLSGSSNNYNVHTSNSNNYNAHTSNSNNYNAHTSNQHYSPRPNTGAKVEVHHHYHYSPPQQITYGSVYHPVYHGKPPIYVYEYRDSGSRYDNLLTGLALYNLGRMSANSHYRRYNHGEYSGTHGEICKLGISKPNGEYEESRIDCKLMSTFIWEAETSQNGQVLSNSSSTTITNTTKIINQSANGNVTVISTTTKVENDALKMKGQSIAVTPGMICYMIRIYRNESTLKKNVECGLLQEYARRSLHNTAVGLKPMMISLNVMIVILMFY